MRAEANTRKLIVTWVFMQPQCAWDARTSRFFSGGNLSRV
jgi:hypothetical protein